MEFEEARLIFDVWRSNIVTLEKLSLLFDFVPPFFLPHPLDQTIEALNIMMKSIHERGDQKAARSILELMMLQLPTYESDDEALTDMRKTIDWMMDQPELKNAKLGQLRRSRDSWIKFYKENPGWRIGER